MDWIIASSLLNTVYKLDFGDNRTLITRLRLVINFNYKSPVAAYGLDWSTCNFTIIPSISSINSILVVWKTTTATICCTPCVAYLTHLIIDDIDYIHRVTINYPLNWISATGVVAISYLSSLEIMFAKMAAFGTRLTTTCLDTVATNSASKD